MNRVLVTGVDRTAGCNLALAWADDWEVLGVCFDEEVQFAGLETRYCHRHDQQQLARLVDEFQPQWIVHCGAVSAASWDLSDSQQFHGEREAKTAAALAEAARSATCRLAVLATDGVVGGPRMFHDECSPTTGAGAAAEAARQLELALASTDALVVRTHVYGWSPVPAHAGFAERVWISLSSGDAPTVDGVRYATPILATDLAARLARAYELRLQGLLHVCGAERTNPHRFAHELALACGLAPPQPRDDVNSAPFKTAAEREETSLNCRRASRALEIPMPLLREGLQRFAAHLHDGWRDRCQAGSLIDATRDHAA